MLTVNALDFMNYKSALKGNYRKGVHVFRCILENPTQAADFAANLGGVCVVFGVPIGQDDRNSQQLLALLQASSVIDQAALTWVSQWYPDYADDWNTMAADSDRAGEMAANELIWRAVGSSPVGAGKVIATIAGLNCQDYADMTAVAASSTAMAAVTASPTAMAAIATSSMATAKYAASAAGLNPADYDDMTELAASSTAMAAVIANSTALNAVVSSSVAMTAVAASQTAMAAVAASSTARVAITSSATAKSALASSPLKQSVSTTAASGSYKQLVSGRACFIISATHNNSGWTFGLRYLYTSATGSEAKTYSSTTSAQSINLFTTNAGLAAFANSGSATSGNLTLSYIPC